MASRTPSSTSADLQGDSSLQVEISDAVSERDKVKFTVQTKSCVPHFSRPEFSVVRHHEEFIWLHNAYVENAEYAGLILCPSLEQIPPAPPRPDFEASREKLQKLGEGDSSITREEFAKMKEELEAEYLAIFKKTVAMHEVFLQRLAAHPTLRRDHNFFVFLEYSQDLSVRGKNRKELLGGFLRNIVKSADEALITGMSGLKEVDDFFEHERTFLLEYHTRIRDACLRADQVMHSHKCVADDYIPISAALSSLGTQEVNQLKTSFLKLAELFERLRKLEGRVASDEDLKLSDMLRYYVRDSQAAKGSCAPAGPRTCCTGGCGRWRTMRTPIRHWTRRAPGTGRCGAPSATSSCAASALNASPTQPSRSSWTSDAVASPPSARTSPSWRSWSSSTLRPAPSFSGTPLSSSKGNLRATRVPPPTSHSDKMPPSPPQEPLTMPRDFSGQGLPLPQGARP
ncbi:sorting nexin-32 isoform X3 [Mesoplodon densirostris]|uniref:sorting nexin-32 isoform X3 n=1 Tax=Mesoplodon densirostris TaxID=48708 RepID=UPI0028DC9AFD|nr:sorting nexin-32 isoform X3 [Mesoplodon densirostris]